MIVDQLVMGVGETSPHTMSFSFLLEAGETINTCVPSSRHGATGVDTTATFLVGAPVVASPLVTQTFKALALTHGQTQIVKYPMVTNLGREYAPELEVRIVQH